MSLGNLLGSRVCRLLAATASFIAFSSGFAQNAAQDDGGAWPWAKYGISKTDNPACIPVPRKEGWAMDQHKSIMANCKSPGLKVVFLGDSITHAFQYGSGAKVWREYCAPLGSSAYAVPADKTENVLWRITEGGELDGINPKVVVILIGINNLYATPSSPEDVAMGVTAIVNCVKGKLPNAKILLLGIFPCFSVDHAGTVKARAANGIIGKLHDGRQVFFLDIGDNFIEPDKTISKEKLKDGLHPSEIGYRIWVDAMRPYLDDLLNNDGNGEVWKSAGANGVRAELKKQ